MKKTMIFMLLVCLVQTAGFAGVQQMEFMMSDDVVEINEPVTLELLVFDESGQAINDYQTLKEIVVGASDGTGFFALENGRRCRASFNP